MTALTLRVATGARTRNEAIGLAELAVDHVLRRWIKDLAGFVWDVRPESSEILREMINPEKRKAGRTNGG